MTLPVSFELRAAGDAGQPGRTIAKTTWNLEPGWRELHLEFPLAPWCKAWRQDFLWLTLTDYAPHEHNRIGSSITIKDGPNGWNMGHVPTWIHPASPNSLSIWPVDLRPDWRPAADGITRAWLVTHNLTEAPGARIRRRLRRELAAA